MRSLSQLMDLTGRKGLISGGAGHIGLAVGEALVELGATVAILDLEAATSQTANGLLKRLRERGAIVVPCDLRDELATRAAVQDAIRTMGGLDILVHCAALVGAAQIPGWDVPFEQQTAEAWDAGMRVNLTSAFVMAQEAKEALQGSGHGSIILFSSIYGMVGTDARLYADTPMINPVGYGASKGGLIQLTRYLATLLAPRIRVNAISPGGVWRNQPEAFHQRYISRTPLGRMAAEEDLKGAVAYLASDLSAYVTGHNLTVDGGWTAW